MNILKTKETSKYILEMIKNADEFIGIISPYLQIRNKYLDEIINKEVDITIVYGKTDMLPELEKNLHSIKNLNILFCKNLHAKIYYSDKICIVSSMNFYKFSEENNIEISVLFQKNEKGYQEVLNVCSEIIKISYLEKLSKNLDNNIGFCIRTGIKINFNPDKPFCKEAFEEWNVYKNIHYKEKYCHLTGEVSNGNTSFAKPILKK